VPCVCVGSYFGGRLVGGRVARFGRDEECFGFIEPMKIGHGYTLVYLLRYLG
jgi:hypothetical protein